MSGPAAADAATARPVARHAWARHLRRHAQLTRRDVLRVVGLTLLGIAGAGVGAALSPAAHATVGPLAVQVQVRPSLHPGVAVALPPVGDVRFDTHHAPVEARASIQSVDVDAAKAVIDSPSRLDALARTAPDTLRDTVVRALLGMAGCAALGAAVVLALATRGWHGAVAGLGLAAGLLVLLTAGTALTFDGKALGQPRFTGLLSSAPYIQRRTQTLADRLQSYRSGLADFVQSATTLYAVGDQLQASNADTQDVTTVLHVSDIHLNPIGYDLTDRLVDQFGVDAVLDTGDLSTWGSQAEASFVNRIGSLKVPYVFIRGNHDSDRIARAVARQPNAVVLDDDVRTVDGLRIAGIADPRNTPSEGAQDDVGKDAVAASAQRLGLTVEDERLAHPDAPVQIAMVHDPTRLDGLVGQVPLVLAGHLHARRVSVQDGTRVMVEGSTGGAGLTANGLRSLTDGTPVPLEATLLYFRRSGPDAGRLLAYDSVTVGGLGLTSVSIDRTTVPDTPFTPVGSGPAPTPSGSPSATPSATPGGTSTAR